MATTEIGYGVLSLGEKANELEGRGFIPIRRELGVGAFGVNGLYQSTAGEPVVGEHDERGPGANGQEELYVVLQGGASFTIDGEEVDAPAGTAVLVQAGVKRKATATSDETIVLAVGGIRGEAYRVPPGGMLRPFFAQHEAKDYDAALAELEKVFEIYPDNALLSYNVACCEALLGRNEDALATLATAIDKWPQFKENAREDEDFASVRDDPRFLELIG